MKIIFEQRNTRYIVEDDIDYHTADELKRIFSRILVQATYSPSVIDCEDGGSYEYVGDDEIIVKKEKIEK